MKRSSTRTGVIVAGTLMAAMFWLMNFSPWATQLSIGGTICSATLHSPLCRFLGGPDDSQGDETPAKLQELYLQRLDQWVAAGGELATAQKAVVENCGMLIMAMANPDQQKAFIGNEREEFDTRVDICTKLTAHRVHPQPEFSKPKIIKMVCEDWAYSYAKLCQRAGLAPR